MSLQLQQALAELHLQPGEIYRTEVNGHEVEVRILESSSSVEPAEETSELDGMVMMVPWFTIPDAPTIVTLKAKPGALPLSDPPIIPDEFECRRGALNWPQMNTDEHR